MPDDPGMQHLSGQASVRDRASMNNCMNNSGLPRHLRVREAGTESRRMVSTQCLAGFWFWFFFLIFRVNPQGGRGVSLYRTRVFRFWIKCNHQMYGKGIKGSFSILLHLKANQNSLHVLLYLEKSNNYT